MAPFGTPRAAWRDVAAMWLLGLINNAGYNISLAVANEVSGESGVCLCEEREQAEAGRATFFSSLYRSRAARWVQFFWWRFSRLSS